MESKENENNVAAPAAAAPQGAGQAKWYRWRKDGVALFRYLMDSEVHTYAFSVAANAILSFIPFIVLLYTLAHAVFHSDLTVVAIKDPTTMAGVITNMIHLFFPSDQQFVALNLAGVAALSSRHGVQLFSLLMIVVACTGIFLPLEVALNQAWGVTKSRNYVMNQVVAFGLALLMVVLGMGTVLVNAWARQVLKFILVHQTNIRILDFVLNFTYQGTSLFLLAATTGVASILFFFSVYWLLPNRRISPRPVMRTAIITGVIWLAAKYIFEAVLPHMDLESLYGRFQVSVGLLIWGYISGLIMFAGAQFSVARLGTKGLRD
jgi:YihY family inner membrane protein